MYGGASQPAEGSHSPPFILHYHAPSGPCGGLVFHMNINGQLRGKDTMQPIRVRLLCLLQTHGTTSRRWLSPGPVADGLHSRSQSGCLLEQGQINSDQPRSFDPPYHHRRAAPGPTRSMFRRPQTTSTRPLPPYDHCGFLVAILTVYNSLQPTQAMGYCPLSSFS